MSEQRHTASSITDVDLDRMYRRIETLEHVAHSNLRHVQLIVPELERAEAAIKRVRQVLDDLPHQYAVARIRGALDETQEQRP